jgi:hypothetical protein
MTMKMVIVFDGRVSDRSPNGNRIDISLQFSTRILTLKNQVPIMPMTDQEGAIASPNEFDHAENESLDLGAPYSQRWHRDEWLNIASDKQEKGHNWARLLAMHEPKMEGLTHASA